MKVEKGKGKGERQGRGAEKGRKRRREEREIERDPVLFTTMSSSSPSGHRKVLP